jgi:hypothetical protein
MIKPIEITLNLTNSQTGVEKPYTKDIRVTMEMVKRHLGSSKDAEGKAIRADHVVISYSPRSVGDERPRVIYAGENPKAAMDSVFRNVTSSAHRVVWCYFSGYQAEAEIIATNEDCIGPDAPWKSQFEVAEERFGVQWFS